MNFPHLNPLWLPLEAISWKVEGALLISLFCRPNQSKKKARRPRCSSWPICETSKSWWVFIFHCFLDWSNASQTANERMYHDAKENVFSTHPIVIHLARIATINATMKMYSCWRSINSSTIQNVFFFRCSFTLVIIIYGLQFRSYVNIKRILGSGFVCISMITLSQPARIIGWLIEKQFVDLLIVYGAVRVSCRDFIQNVRYEWCGEVLSCCCCCSSTSIVGVIIFFTIIWPLWINKRKSDLKSYPLLFCTPNFFPFISTMAV